MVEAARFSNSLDAGVARGRLEAEGLHCVLFDSGFSSVEGVGPFIPVRLMVLEEDLEEALVALRGAAEPDAPRPRRHARSLLRTGGWLAVATIAVPWAWYLWLTR